MIIRRLFQNLSLFILALLLATVVWFVAVSEENPIEQRVFPRPLSITATGLPGDMFLVEEINTEVAVTIRARASVWAGLTSNRVRVTADLTGLEPGEHTVPLVGFVDDEEAEVVSTAPNEVQVVLERITSRTLPIGVAVIGDPATGYKVHPPVLSADSVQITGPEAQVNAVSEIGVEVDLEGRKETLEHSFTLRPTDSKGQFVPGLTLEPDSLDVTIVLEQLESYRDVAVRAIIEGEIAPGYRVTNITTTPSVVTVFSGDPLQVANLPGFVETYVLDIADASDDVEARLTLQLPEGISLVGDQAVLVQVGIAAIESSLTMQHEIEFTGLEVGLAAIPSPETVELILSGPLPTLDALQPEDVKVIVDLLGLDVGTYQITPEVIVGLDVNVETVLPASVQVEIEIDTSTPTPTVDPNSTATFTPTVDPNSTATPTPTPDISTTTPTATQTPGGRTPTSTLAEG